MLTKTLTAVALGSLLLAAPAMAQSEWTIDRSHTHVMFSVSHLGFSNTHGEFDGFEGTFMLDPEDPTTASISLTIDAGSVDTNWPARDEHLVSPDFFDVQTYPTITFESTGVEQTGADTAEVTGDLTILGVTHPVVLDVVLNGVAPNPFNPAVTVAGFTATTSISRSDFGMVFGVPAIGDEVIIRLEMEATRAS